MATTRIGSNAQYLGGSKSLISIGSHVYAYSGPVSVDDNYTTLLEFNTGKGYIIATLQPAVMDAVTDDYEYKILLNGEQLMSTFTDNYKAYSPYSEVELLLPPNSHFKVQGANRANSNANNVGIIFVGKQLK